VKESRLNGVDVLRGNKEGHSPGVTFFILRYCKQAETRLKTLYYDRFNGGWLST
jgi:hypothetical protein